MMHTNKAKVILNFLHQTESYDQTCSDKVLMYIQLIGHAPLMFLDIYIIWEEDYQLLCLVDDIQDRHYLKLELIDPSFFENKLMFFKVYKKKERPSILEKYSELSQIKDLK